MLIDSLMSLNTIGLFHVFFCSYVAILVLVSLPIYRKLIDPQYDFIYGKTAKVFNRIELPTPSMGAHSVCVVIFAASLMFSALGFFIKPMLLLALILYFIVFSSLIRHEEVGRKTHLYPLIIVVLLLTPDLNSGAEQENAYWPVWLIKLLWVQLYFSAAIQKIIGTGLRQWMSGASFQTYLIAHDAWYDIPMAKALAKKPMLCALMASAVILFQLTTWLVLLFPQLSLIYAFVGLLFHVSTGVVMRIHYLKYIVASYLILLLDGASFYSLLN